MLRKLIFAATLAAAALAQSTTRSASASASKTADAAAATHTIKVGYPFGDHKMTPEQSTAKKGDTIVFEFWPRNHSLVLMDPDTPCIPYNKVKQLAPERQMWWSGFFNFSSDDVSSRPYNARTYTVTLDTEDPVYFYCSQTESCETYGMIGVINGESDDKFKEVQKAAIAKDYALSPGESIPEEGGPKNKPADPNSKDDKSSALSPGAIAGIVIGAVAAFALVGLLFFFVGRRKKAGEASAAAATQAPYDPNATAMAQASMPLTAHHTGATGGYMDPENPPMYQSDPRYSQALSSPGYKPGHQSMLSEIGSGDVEAYSPGNPNRMSELPSNSQEPVEIYTHDSNSRS